MTFCYLRFFYFAKMKSGKNLLDPGCLVVAFSEGNVFHLSSQLPTYPIFPAPAQIKLNIFNHNDFIFILLLMVLFFSQQNILFFLTLIIVLNHNVAITFLCNHHDYPGFLFLLLLLSQKVPYHTPFGWEQPSVDIKLVLLGTDSNNKKVKSF